MFKCIKGIVPGDNYVIRSWGCGSLIMSVLCVDKLHWCRKCSFCVEQRFIFTPHCDLQTVTGPWMSSCVPHTQHHTLPHHPYQSAVSDANHAIRRISDWNVLDQTPKQALIKPSHHQWNPPLFVWSDSEIAEAIFNMLMEHSEHWTSEETRQTNLLIVGKSLEAQSSIQSTLSWGTLFDGNERTAVLMHCVQARCTDWQFY